MSTEANKINNFFKTETIYVIIFVEGLCLKIINRKEEVKSR